MKLPEDLEISTGLDTRADNPVATTKVDMISQTHPCPKKDPCFLYGTSPVKDVIRPCTPQTTSERIQLFSNTTGL
eukprot:scaffold451109_cov22-Prasinocladus_malaysianus.AAC.1